MAIQQKKAKVKGVADIVFCIDFSGSMDSCINGVKENIQIFVKSLEKTNPNMKIDWQVAFCGYTDTDFNIQEFTTDVDLFSKNLGIAKGIGYDEFTSGAIDFCISHFQWRSVSNKFVIVFTDEELESGYIGDDVKFNFPKLLAKIGDSRIRLFYFGPKCPYYNKFEKVSRSIVKYYDDGFDDVDFLDLLSSLGKTVSQSCGQGSSEKYDDYVYNLNKITITKL